MYLGMENTSTQITLSNIYNYTIRVPPDGNCESRKIGHVGPIQELGNCIFASATAAQGIFGMWTSQQASITCHYLYALLFGYGAMSALYSIKLWNGFLRTAQVMINLLQMLSIITLGVSLTKFMPFDWFRRYHITDFMLLTAGLYPIVVHIIGSSYNSEWVGWLTFDFIWIIPLILNGLIWYNRKTYRDYNIYPGVFYNGWLAMACCVIAYVFWILDRFACSLPVACLYPLGWWYFFMGLCFYYITTLYTFLSAEDEGHYPKVWKWPTRVCHVILTVQWQLHPTGVDDGEQTEDTAGQQADNVSQHSIQDPSDPSIEVPDDDKLIEP